MNLLEETVEDIGRSGKDIWDIEFIGSVYTGHACTWDEFLILADIEYDSGYGTAEIARDLKIVFSDSSYMHRGEYDGSEWWIYEPITPIPNIRLPIRSLTVSFTRATLGEMHNA